VILIEPDVHADARGFFFESYHQEKFAALGIRDRFVQDNHSRSVRNTLRGLHYQLHRPQAKLCRVAQGEVLDVAVDIRRGSPTFGKSIAAKLSAENRRQIYVPPDFAHGFVVLSETAEFLYKCSDFYDPADERGILWNDPELNIEWGIREPILSAKDQQYPRLGEVRPEALPLYRARAQSNQARLLSLGKHPPVLRTRNAKLEAAGHEVVRASSVEEAGEALAASKFDLMIVGYTFSRPEKRKLVNLAGEIGLPVLLLYIKPADMSIPAAAHVNALHGEDALLSTVAALLSEKAASTPA
jgi:dTDP-4-dehydrorhamnose 3,5-epimerase